MMYWCLCGYPTAVGGGVSFDWTHTGVILCYESIILSKESFPGRQMSGSHGMERPTAQTSAWTLYRQTCERTAYLAVRLAIPCSHQLVGAPYGSNVNHNKAIPPVGLDNQLWNN